MANPVLMTVLDQVMTITINRPEARNAVDLAVATGIAEAIDAADARDDVAAIILTGTGEHFCAGMDLKAFAAGEVPVVAGRGFAGITDRLPRKPLLAAVEGYALAGGTELALSADIVIASRTASFGLPEVTRGLVAASGGVIRLAKTLPHHLAMELALTGDRLDASTAHHHGLVNHLTEPGGALDHARRIAAKIAANAPLAVDASKRIVAATTGWSTPSHFAIQHEVAASVQASADALEGARAFAQKRAPIWKGV
ncbi:crotonase/enoyl-CoA hydratase family protein [Nocardia fluminea]|uniref:crotonase/enoyl-CoA hydratase family protein n=1 Tax=Nocardia fluminea TaxID=134984 RepID=UPI0036616D20